MINYGTHRPKMGNEIDLSPATNLPAPDARRRIPWLWAEVLRPIATENINITGDGEFSTEAMTRRHRRTEREE